MNKHIGKRIAAVPALLLLAIHVQADNKELLYGEWGTDTQCARELISPKGTKYAAPFNIQPNWLEQNDVWCRLSWLSITENTDGVFALAQAQCGEDSIRDYRITFELIESELNIRWNLSLKNGPLLRCDKQ